MRALENMHESWAGLDMYIQVMGYFYQQISRVIGVKCLWSSIDREKNRSLWNQLDKMQFIYFQNA